MGWGCLEAELPPSPLHHCPAAGQGRESEKQKQEKLALSLGGQDKDCLLHEEKTETMHPPSKKKTNNKNQNPKQIQKNKCQKVTFSILFKISFFLSLEDFFLSLDDSQLSTYRRASLSKLSISDCQVKSVIHFC